MLLSAIRLPGDRDGLEIWIPIVAEGAKVGGDDLVESWRLLRRLNHESRFTHDWRIVSGDESRPGLRGRLSLDALEPRTFTLSRVERPVRRVVARARRRAT